PRALRRQDALARALEPPLLPARHALLALVLLGARIEAVGLVRGFLQGLEAERAREQALVPQAMDQGRHLAPVAQAHERARALEAEVAVHALVAPRESVDVLAGARVERRAQRREGRGRDVVARVLREGQERREGGLADRREPADLLEAVEAV